MLCGMVVLAMPITVIGSAFSAEYALMKKQLARATKAEREEQAEFDRLILIEEALLAGHDPEEATAAAEAATAAAATAGAANGSGAAAGVGTGG